MESCELYNLESINLTNNQFCFIPSCILDMTNYYWEQDTSNCGCPSIEDGFVELFDECYNIVETTELDLSYSGISGQIPSNLYYLTNLEQLRLNNNELTGEISPDIGQLVNLEKLDLKSNSLSDTIPLTLSNLQNLIELN